ncbi:MAG: alkaline phosphatase family protein, partial [Nitrospira sp.]|nr:alkaline phosphatase family protein [Nitrospira sp.]
MSNKLLIIGLDGGTFDLIKPWAGEGKLPNLARLLEEGVHSRLNSTIPPMTFPAWNTFMTGKNPGKHGVYDFTERKQGSYEVQFVNGGMRRSKTIWQIMNEAGKSAGIMAVPATYPPEKVRPFMISGFDTPGMTSPKGKASSMFPQEIFEELNREVGEYVVTSNVHGDIVKGNLDVAERKILSTIETKASHAKYLYKKYQPDCFMIVFGETDLVCHNFWHLYDPRSPLHNTEEGRKYRDTILHIYQKVDEKIGELLSLSSEDTSVMIMSDHGFGGSGDKAVYLNNWLAENGFLSFKDTSYSSIKNDILQGVKRAGLKFVPAKLKGKIIRSTSVKFVNKLESSLRFSQINWSGTKAFSEETPHFPSVWVNVKGRDPEGIVEPGKEYEKVRDEIIQKLYSFKDQFTGKSVVNKVYRREEVYHGNYMEKAPDIVIDWALSDGYTYLSEPSKPARFRETIKKLTPSEVHTARFGSHRQHGIFMLYGGPLEKGIELDNTNIADLAPTALYLLGLPVPEDMDGVVLKEGFKKSYLSEHPISRIKSNGDYSNEKDTSVYSQDEEDAVRDRLS